MKNPNFKNIIIQAWSGMLVVLIAMLLLDPLRYLMQGQTQELAKVLIHDPGVVGLQVLITMLAFNILFQLALQIANGKKFRLFTLVISCLYGLFFLLHNLIHFVGGEPLGLQTVLDFTHHILAISACIYSWKWYCLNDTPLT